jgi:Zn-dependent protease
MPPASRRVPTMSTAPAAPTGAVRIGTVAGVPIYLDRTWLILALVIAWTGWQSARGLGTGMQVAYALWLVVGILVAVLAHEVGHAVVARGLGFRVHRVMATLMGGHTAYDGTGATAGRTAAVAVAGPAANLVLAGVGLLGTLLASWPVGVFASSFAWMNLLLALFNLLPGLPLDGGAVVQSAVWGASGRRDLGTLVAGWAGRVVAVGILLWFAVWPVVQGRPDLFFVAIGALMAWILWQGATAALGRAPLEKLLRVVQPEQLLEPVAVLDARTPVGEVAGAAHRVVALDERGLPTLLLPGPAAGAPDLAALPPSTPLASVLVRVPDGSVVDLPPGGDVEPLLRAMQATGWGVVVVTGGGRVRGLVTAERLDAVAKQALGRN